MRATALRRPRPATTPATHAVFEQRTRTDPGTPSQWVIVLVELDADATRTLRAWHGVGPLGRLRAWRDALEHCALEHITPKEQLEEERAPSRSLAWEHARLLARLRDEGVIAPRGATLKKSATRSAIASLIDTVRTRRKGRQRYAERRKSHKE